MAEHAAGSGAGAPIPPGARAGYSFSSATGPLPAAVADEVAEACRGWRGGASVLNLPFTTPAYRALQEETEACLVRLLAIPRGVRVLFMHGGASSQFSLVPLNLLGDSHVAAYVDSGHWSRRAIAEAARYGEVCVVARATAAIPDEDEWRLDRRATYCHITTNETADGIQFDHLPRIAAPLVADMTSDFLTRPLDFSRLALGYAGTQKTIGVPGLTVVLVREDLLGRARAATPRVLDYTAQAEAASRLNTPPVFSLFVAHRMLHWIEAHGGVQAMAQAAARRSAAIYHALDASSGFYRTPAAVSHRSRINPCFRLADEALVERFVAEAEDAGLRDLRGHPQVGGVRVSLYNGVDDAAVERLAAFIGGFARRHG